MKKKGIFFILVFFFILSCSDKRYHIEMAKNLCRELSLLPCIDSFFDHDFLKRGDMYIFYDVDYRIETHFSNNQLIIDTIFPIVQTETSYVHLDSLKFRNMTNIVKCFNSLNIEFMRVKGFNQDKMKLIEFSVNDFLLLYYTPDLNDVGVKQKEILQDKAIFLKDKWYCFIKKEKNSPSIW